MPNIRRTFPVKETASEDPPEQPQYHAAAPRGKQLRMGGKQLGAMHHDDDDEDDSSEEEHQQVYARGSGKQLPRPGGKYMRPPVQDDDDDSDDDDEDELKDDDEEEPVRVMPRGGGKGLIRYRAQQDESEEEEEEPEPVRVVARSGGGGGKSLSRMQPPPQQDSDEDESEEEEEEQVVQPVSRGGGKNIYRSPAGGKQLRRPEPEENQGEPPAPLKTSTTISRSPAGGKQLRRPEPANEQPEEPQQIKAISRSPAGGKQLRRPEPEDENVEPEKPKPAKTSISRSPAGGKQLRRATAKDEEEESEDEMELDSDEGDDDDDDDDYQETFVAKPKPAAKRGRPRRATAAKKKVVVQEEQDDEDFLDDEVSSSDEEAELDINNTEALIENEEDRKYLDSLPELEREAILGERFEKLKEQQDMKKAMREAKRKESEKTAAADKATKKRKAAAAKKPSKKAKTDADEELAKTLYGRRESTRDKDAKGAKSKKAAALATLRKERKIQLDRMDEESDDSELDFGDDDDDSDDDYEELKPWQKKATKATKSTISRLDQGGSDDDMDIDEDDDEEPRLRKDRRMAADRSRTPIVEANLEDFRKVTIPRRRLARWCHEPFFDAAVLECFVRLFIGEDDNGEKVYRLCEITNVVEGKKSYKFPVTNKNEKPVSTNKQLGLKFGNSEREFPMYLVSDDTPKEKDVQKYIAVQKNLRQEVLSKRRASKLRRLQDNLVNNYTYTKEDIERNLEARKKQGKSAANLGSEQTRVAIAVKGAKDRVAEAERRLAEAKRKLTEGDDAEEAELMELVKEAEKALVDSKNNLEAKLEEERNTLAAVEERKRRLAKRKKDVNWAKVNERAIQANRKVDREAGKPQQATVSASGKKEEFNPYARRKVKPKILWKVGQTEVDEGKEEETSEEKKESRDEPQKDELVTIDIEAPGLIHEPAEKNLSESHQFAIDEEVLAQTSTSQLGLGSKNGTTNQRVRKGLSLSDYLERKANGSL